MLRTLVPLAMGGPMNVETKATKAVATVLILRTCAADGTSHSGFKWPTKGPVSCDDWNPEPKCGNGLHGFLAGEGDGSLANWDLDAIWQVIEVPVASIVKIDSSKVKFPSGVVVYSGSRDVATKMISDVYPGKAVIGGTATAGNRGTATAGDSGTATAGDRGTATAGDSGTATAGNRGTATAGNRGTATAGDSGTATAGDYGTATAGNRGTATAGEKGEIRIRFWDSSAERYRTLIGYVGEDGIKANVRYRIVAGKLAEVLP